MLNDEVKVLFVCLGNICRSPTAQGIFEHMVKEAGLEDKIIIDSAGTAGYHIGVQPDKRSQAAALKRNYDLSAQRARKVEYEDFVEFDYILAMDESNFEDIKEIAPRELYHKIHLILDYGSSGKKSVPDPYYGGEKGFELVLDLLEEACEGLLKKIRKEFLI